MDRTHRSFFLAEKMLTLQQKRTLQQIVLYNPTTDPSGMLQDILDHTRINNWGRFVVVCYFVKCMVCAYPMHSPLLLMCVAKFYIKEMWKNILSVLKETPKETHNHEQQL